MSNAEEDSSTNTRLTRALSLIDEAHAQDPNLHDPKRHSPIVTSNPNEPESKSIPYELHYAQRMTHHLYALHPHPSEPLQLAVRAQHFRRWEVPRSSYPATRIGYHSWRTFLKKRQASQVEEIVRSVGYSEDEAGRVASLIRKEGLAPRVTAGKSVGAEAGGAANVASKGDGVIDGEGVDEEAQTLEDAACLVFLEDQFEGYVESGGLGDEEKVVGILRKTWGKMSDRGRDVARGMVGGLGEKAGELIKRALEGQEE